MYCHSNRYYSSLLDSTKPTLVFGPLFKCEFNDSSNKVKSRLKSQINWKLSIENQNSKSLWLRVLCSVHSVQKLDFWSKNWIQLKSEIEFSWQKWKVLTRYTKVQTNTRPVKFERIHTVYMYYIYSVSTKTPNTPSELP